MEEQDLGLVWTKTLEALSSGILTNQQRAFVALTQPMGVVGDTVLVAAPNAFNKDVLESQQSRHVLFEALKRGNHFPWDFQPLRDASEQYTRNHMSVTDRDLQSRFPHAPDIEGKRRRT